MEVRSLTMVIKGWLFDAYPLDNRMVFWIKQENGNTIRLEDNYWSHSIYVASDYICKSELEKLILKQQQQGNNSKLIKDYEFVSKYKRITDITRSDVLKLTLSDPTKALTLARRIERFDKFGKLRLYNVDLLPAQSYFYDHDIFPLAFCEVYNSSNTSRDNTTCSKLSWNIKEEEDVWSIDYLIPHFKIIHLDIELKKEGKIPKYTDRIDSISIKQNDGNEDIEIRNESEQDTIDELTAKVAKIDPDFIFTEDGDSFTFPYLIHRAEINNTELILGRERSVPIKKPTKEGISYFSYGRIYFKPATQKILGRIHLDKSNSFLWNESSGLHGLYEIARICRMPLHTASRASIGKCLSSLQFYYATQKDILIPWKPTLAEHLKTFEEFIVADRGGFIFEPKIGVHEQVAEFDFISLYPSIMLKKNVSAETIQCSCCPDSKVRVPELDYNICEKRTGIIPLSLKIIIDKRSRYKHLLKSSTISSELKSIYDARQNSLKWILVTSFGYLGFNNAKFGRIDAHIAVCAFDRQILLQTAKIAERDGFRILHGIVDSLWIQQKKKKNIPITKQDYLELKESIEEQIGFAISFEGIYKWIAFVPSKINNQLPVPNRYFGVFEEGNSLKVRGLEARRHDTPPFFSKCQQEILEIMARGNSINEVKALMPEVSDAFRKYSQLLKENKVPLEELVFTKQTSKNSNEYQINRNTIENDAMQQLDIEGKSLKAGQILKYVITDYYNRRKKYSKNNRRRTIPVELINEKITTTTTASYDVRKYIELLAETCNSVTQPFGYAF
jgi:DNA polymerase I